MTRLGRSYGSMSAGGSQPFLSDPEAAVARSTPFRIVASDGTIQYTTPQEAEARQNPMKKMLLYGFGGLAVLAIVAAALSGGSAADRTLAGTTMSAQTMSMLATPIKKAGDQEITKKEKNDDPHYNRKDAEDDADKFKGKAKDAKDDRDKQEKKADEAKKEKKHWEKEAEKEHDIAKDKKHEKKKDRHAAAKKEKKDEKKEKDAKEEQHDREKKADEYNKERKHYEKKEDAADEEAKVQGKAEKKERFAVLVIGNNQSSSVHVFRWLNNDTLRTIEEIASHTIEPGITAELTPLIPEVADWHKWADGKGSADWHKYAKSGADWKNYAPPDPKPGNKYALERLDKLLDFAEDHVPKSFQDDTEIIYIGGNSYKTLDVAANEKNLGHIRDHLSKSKFKFHSSQAFTVDSTREAVFSWLTANQHANRLSKKDKKLIGAVYLGADSTGVVYPLHRLGGRHSGSAPIPIDGAMTHAGDNRFSLKLHFLPDTAIYAGAIDGYGLDTAFHSLVLEPTHRLHKKSGDILFSSSCLGRGFDIELGRDEAEEVKGGKKHDVVIVGKGDAKACEKAVSKSTRQRLKINSDSSADEFAATGDLGVLSLLGSDLLPKKQRHRGVRLGDLHHIGDEACDAHPNDWQKTFDGVVEVNQVVPPAACVGLSVVNALVDVRGNAHHAELLPDVRYNYIDKKKAQKHVAASHYKEKDFADARVSQGIDIAKHQHSTSGKDIGDKYREKYAGGDGKKPAWQKYIPKGVMGIQWELEEDNTELAVDQEEEGYDIEAKRKHTKRPEHEGRTTGDAYENKYDKPVAREMATPRLRGDAEEATEEYDVEFKRSKKEKDTEPAWGKFAGDEANPANGDKYAKNGWFVEEEENEAGEAVDFMDAKRKKKDADTAAGWDKYAAGEADPANGKRFSDKYTKQYRGFTTAEVDVEDIEDIEEAEIYAKRKASKKSSKKDSKDASQAEADRQAEIGKRYRDKYAGQYAGKSVNAEADFEDITIEAKKKADQPAGGDWGKDADEADPANGKRYRDAYSKKYGYSSKFIIEGNPEENMVAETTVEEEAVAQEEDEQAVEKIEQEEGAEFAASIVDARRRRKGEEYEVHRDSWALGAFLYVKGQGKDLW